jgi:hypothetical protein
MNAFILKKCHVMDKIFSTIENFLYIIAYNID